MTDAAVVLEGGSLRCLFTSGVLDAFLEHDVEFSYVSGVSAGSMCAMSYISKQMGRTRDVNLNFVRDRRYLSLRNMLHRRELFDFDFVFGELSTTLIPFDWETFEESGQRFVVAATRCLTGEPEYFEKGVCTDLTAAVAASSSLPLVSKMVTVEGKKYLDGGLSMPIPYGKAMEEGYGKIVLVLSRHKGYRKPPAPEWKKRAYRRYFEPLPRLLQAINDIPDRYNRMQDEIDGLEEAGRIFVIRPAQPVTVSRFEKDKRKLEELYYIGRNRAEGMMPELRAYLQA